MRRGRLAWGWDPDFLTRDDDGKYQSITVRLRWKTYQQALIDNAPITPAERAVVEALLDGWQDLREVPMALDDAVAALKAEREGE